MHCELQKPLVIAAAPLELLLAGTNFLSHQMHCAVPPMPLLLLLVLASPSLGGGGGGGDGDADDEDDLVKSTIIGGFFGGAILALYEKPSWVLGAAEYARAAGVAALGSVLIRLPLPPDFSSSSNDDDADESERRLSNGHLWLVLAGLDAAGGRLRFLGERDIDLDWETSTPALRGEA
jgi:hypothetical protein